MDSAKAARCRPRANAQRRAERLLGLAPLPELAAMLVLPAAVLEFGAPETAETDFQSPLVSHVLNLNAALNAEPHPSSADCYLYCSLFPKPRGFHWTGSRVQMRPKLPMLLLLRVPSGELLPRGPAGQGRACTADKLQPLFRH